VICGSLVEFECLKMNSCDLCGCGKLKGTLNNTNWARHIETCKKKKKRKLKNNIQNILIFFFL